MNEKCPVCNTTVYPVEKIPFRSEAYHKSCFKCSNCKCALSIGMGNFSENKIFCEKCAKAHSVKSMSKNNYTVEKSHSRKEYTGLPMKWDGAEKYVPWIGLGIKIDTHSLHYCVFEKKT